MEEPVCLKQSCWSREQYVYFRIQHLILAKDLGCDRWTNDGKFCTCDTENRFSDRSINRVINCGVLCDFWICMRID